MKLSPQQRDEAIKRFAKAAGDASYHFASNSELEWSLARQCVQKAVAIFDSYPELHEDLRGIANKQLWKEEFNAARPEGEGNGH